MSYEMLEQQLNGIRDQIASLNDKLNTVAVQVSALGATVAATPRCPDPGACVRVERALSEHNRRLSVLENAESRRGGERAIIGIICTILGSGISMIVSHFLRK